MPRKSSKKRSSTRKSTRQTPAALGHHAKNFKLGTVKVGKDGRDYKVGKRKDGARVWKLVKVNVCAKLDENKCNALPDCVFTKGYKNKKGKEVKGRCSGRKGVLRGVKYQGPINKLPDAFEMSSSEDEQPTVDDLPETASSSEDEKPRPSRVDFRRATLVEEDTSGSSSEDEKPKATKVDLPAEDTNALDNLLGALAQNKERTIVLARTVADKNDIEVGKKLLALRRKI